MDWSRSHFTFEFLLESAFASRPIPETRGVSSATNWSLSHFEKYIRVSPTVCFSLLAQHRDARHFWCFLWSRVLVELFDEANLHEALVLSSPLCVLHVGSTAPSLLLESAFASCPAPETQGVSGAVNWSLSHFEKHIRVSPAVYFSLLAQHQICQAFLVLQISGPD
jgi:hypothetical protein